MSAHDVLMRSCAAHAAMEVETAAVGRASVMAATSKK